MERSTCPSCSASVLASWRSCPSCGSDLVGDAAERAQRATVVVSDLQGSTALAERLDPETLRDVLDQYFDELGRVLESHGGRIEKRIGDAIVTVFAVRDGAPSGDDARRAVRAVAESQATLANLNDRLERTWGVRLTNRTGVATGDVIRVEAGAGHRVLAGDAFAMAGGLEPLAPAMEALVAISTIDELGDGVVVEPASEQRLKGGGVVRAGRLVSVSEDETAERSDDADGGRCAVCGSTIPIDVDPPWAWCAMCGTRLDERGSRQTSRRTLTIVFADLHPATGETGEAQGAEAGRQAVARAFDELRTVLEHHGGVVETFIGDAVMAVFGLAQRREDDAIRAVRAALDMHTALERTNARLETELGVRLELRVGVTTGPVIAGDPKLGQRLVTGDAVNVAARLEQTAAIGDVVIGGLTRRLIGDAALVEELEPLHLKGKAEPVPAFRVAGLAAATASRDRVELPFVGRAAELEALHRTYETAVTTRAYRRVSLVGDAGIGKSRLVYELLDRLPSSTRVIRGACPSYGEGITFWPVVELISMSAGISAGDDGDTARAAIAELVPDRAVVERLWSLAGLTDRQFPVAELSWAVRVMIGELAQDRPLVVVIDGLHWAEPTLLELLDELQRNLHDAPVLLITMARSEADGDGTEPAMDASPAGAQASLETTATTATTATTETTEPTETATDGAETLAIEPLDEPAAAEIIAAAIGHTALPPELAERVTHAAAGNPLFMEQFLTMLTDEGLLRHEHGRWVADRRIEDVHVPPTIEAILAARVDAIGDDERGLLEPASVIGREFSRAAVEELLDGASTASEVGRGADVEPGPQAAEPAWSALLRRQLLVLARDPDVLVDHRFRNLLLRDVVYEGLLKRTRSTLHQRFAEWLEAMALGTGRTIELQEILGYHLEQAYHLRAGLGALDDAAMALGRRAADRLAPAGLRAFGRGDMPAAASLLARAARTLPDGEPTRPRLLARAAEARMETGAFRDSIALYDEAEADALRSEDRVAAGIAESGRLRLRYLTGDGVTDADARELVARLTPIFAAAGDHRALAGCHRLLFNVELTHGQWNAAGVAAEAMISEARLAGDRLMEQRGLPALAGVAMYGPTPVPAAIGRCEAVLDDGGDDRMVRALTERAMANLIAFEGRFDEARTLCRATRDRLVELGWHFDAALVSLNLGPIEMLAGQPEAAARELRADYDTLRAMGEQNYISTTAAYLAEAERLSGHLDEALALAAESASIAAEDDIYTQALWRATRAKALVDPADADESTRLIDEAVAIALGTDDPSVQADMFLARAEVLVRRGDPVGARDSVGEALVRYRAKEHRVGEERAAMALEELR